jgi:hypothetical protein
VVTVYAIASLRVSTHLCLHRHSFTLALHHDQLGIAIIVPLDTRHACISAVLANLRQGFADLVDWETDGDAPLAPGELHSDQYRACLAQRDPKLVEQRSRMQCKIMDQHGISLAYAVFDGKMTFRLLAALLSSVCRSSRSSLRLACPPQAHASSAAKNLLMRDDARTFLFCFFLSTLSPPPIIFLKEKDARITAHQG